jgi:CBS domain-containing protein
MVDRGVTSALIIDEGLLVGIFTSVDALRVLAAGVTPASKREWER